MQHPKSKFKKRIIRAYFSGLEKKGKNREISRDFSSQLAEKGMQYTQMKFLVAKIRLAGEEDFEIIINLYNKAWMTSREPYSRLSLESLKYIYDYPDTKIFIAKLYCIDVAFMILDLEGTNKEFGGHFCSSSTSSFSKQGNRKSNGSICVEFF